MSNNKCLFCSHTFTNLNSLSKHMTTCVKNAEATGQIIANNSTHICNYSKPINSVKQNKKIMLILTNIIQIVILINII